MKFSWDDRVKHEDWGIQKVEQAHDDLTLKKVEHAHDTLKNHFNLLLMMLFSIIVRSGED